MIEHDGHCAESFREHFESGARGTMKKRQRTDVPVSESRRDAIVRLTQVSAFAFAGTLAESKAKGAVKAVAPASPDNEFTPSRFHPIAAGTSPKAFTAKQFAVLTVLVDMIIPRTNTSGASDAGVHWYIDTIAAAKPDVRAKLGQGLDWLDEESNRRFSSGFAQANESDRSHLLMLISDLPEADSTDAGLASGRELFRQVKQMTIQGYYQSEIGMLDELHWVGNQVLAKMPGCPGGIPGDGGQG